MPPRYRPIWPRCIEFWPAIKERLSMSDHARPASTPGARQAAADTSALPLERTPQYGRVAPGSAEEKRLREIWSAPPGWRGWLSTVDHKTIGLRYLVTAFVFLLLGGIEALILRLQLARPNMALLTPEQYNQIF